MDTVLSSWSIAFFAAAIVLFAMQNICFKQFNVNYMKNKASYFLFSAGYFLVVCIVYLFLGVDVTHFDAALMGISSLFAISFISAMYFYMKALEQGPMGLSFLFFSAGMLAPVLFGVIVYNEPAPAHKIAGLLLLFAAFFVSTAGDKAGALSKKWVLYIILGALGNGGIGIAQKLCRTAVSEDALIAVLFLGFAQGAAISLIIGLLLAGRKGERVPHFRSYRFPILLLLTAITTSVGNYLMLLLNLNISALVLYPVLSGSLVITSILASRFVYKEKVTKRHIQSIAAGLAAIVMLSL